MGSASSDVPDPRSFYELPFRPGCAGLPFGSIPKESLVPGVSDRSIPYWMSGRISNPMEIHSAVDVD
jgi:hypothetical protein